MKDSWNKLQLKSYFLLYVDRHYQEEERSVHTIWNNTSEMLREKHLIYISSSLCDGDYIRPKTVRTFDYWQISQPWECNLRWHIKRSSCHFCLSQSPSNIWYFSIFIFILILLFRFRKYKILLVPVLTWRANNN